MIKEIALSDVEMLRSYNNVKKDILDFTTSGWDACEVDITKYSSVETARATYRNAIQKTNNKFVKVQSFGGKLFLVRTVPIKTI